MENKSERALKILSSIQGEGGYSDVINKFKESIEDKKNKIMRLQGEIAGLQTSLLVLQALNKEWGLNQLDLAIRELKFGDQPIAASLPSVKEMKDESKGE